MRKIVLASLFLTTLPLAADDLWCLNYSFNIWADYGYLRRSEIKEKTLVLDGTKKVLTTDDLEDKLGWESAIRGGISYIGNENAYLEAFYTYFYPWESEKTLIGNGTLSAPFSDPFLVLDYIDADKVTAKYTSQLQNAELNYWIVVTPRRVCYFAFAWNIGFRFIYLKENFSLEFVNDTFISDTNIKTLNLLYGAQLGASLDYNPSSAWTWTFQIKGAGFLNDAENNVSMRDDDNVLVLQDYEKRRWVATFLLEGYAQLSYHWFSNLNVHIAYQGFLLTGLALAPEQVHFTTENEPQIREKGQIIIDGLYVGLDFSF